MALVRSTTRAYSPPRAMLARPAKLAPRADVHRSHLRLLWNCALREGHQGSCGLFSATFASTDISRWRTSRSRPSSSKRARLHSKVARLPSHARSSRACVARTGIGAGASANQCSTVVVEAAPSSVLSAPQDGSRTGPRRDRPQLFSVCLSARAAKASTPRRSLGFSIDLGALVPDYEVAGHLWLKAHYPGGYSRDKIHLEAILPAPASALWQLRYGFDRLTPNRATRVAECQAGDAHLEFRIPIEQRNSGRASPQLLVLRAVAWHST